MAVAPSTFSKLTTLVAGSGLIYGKLRNISAPRIWNVPDEEGTVYKITFLPDTWVEMTNLLPQNQDGRDLLLTDQFESAVNGNSLLIAEADEIDNAPAPSSSASPPISSAAELDYDNSVSNMTATNVQAAIDELDGRMDDNLNPAYAHSQETGNPHNTEANDISYDSSTSGLSATDVQAAIDELSSENDELYYVALARSAAVSATITPTDFDKNYTFSNVTNVLAVGDIIDVNFDGVVTAHNASDTLALELRLGSVTLLTLAASAPAVSDRFAGRFSFVIRTVGASGTIVGSGWAVRGASGTATPIFFTLASQTVNTTISNLLALRATWSTNNAGNSCALDIFNVSRRRGN